MSVVLVTGGSGFIAGHTILQLLAAGHEVRTTVRSLQNLLVRLAGLVSPAARQVVPELGKVKSATNDKAKHMLGWSPRTNEDAIIATADSLMKLKRIGALK